MAKSHKVLIANSGSSAGHLHGRELCQESLQCEFQAGGEASLGNKRKNVGRSDTSQANFSSSTRGLGGLPPARSQRGTRRQLLRDLAADQRTAAAIFTSMTKDMAPEDRPAGRGVCLCGWTKQAARPGQDKPKIELHRAETNEGPRAFYRGLSRCKLRWVCPICTRQASEAARDSLNVALAASREAGHVPILITLTARHHVDMSLARFWSALSGAEKALKNLRRWKQMRDSEMVGFAKAVEATHGRHGWHPHFHLLLVMRAGSEAEALDQVAWLRDAWLSQLDRAGLDGTSDAARKRAFDAQGAAAAGAYVTKWGAAEELALSGTKSGRHGGRSPWQLLRDARTGNDEKTRERAAALWFEFVTVFQGVHQLRLSPGLKELVADHREDGEGEAEPPEAVPVVQFGDVDWEIGRWRRTLMREAAEDAPQDEARAAVLTVLMGDQSDSDLDKPDNAEDVELIERDEDQDGGRDDQDRDARGADLRGARDRRHSRRSCESAAAGAYQPPSPAADGGGLAVVAATVDLDGRPHGAGVLPASGGDPTRTVGPVFDRPAGAGIHH